MDIVKKYASEGCIKISWYNEKTDLLGPFFRFAVWLQGCERRCPGCIAEYMQSPSGGKNIKISELASLIISAEECEGITVSGGEPFSQADRLCELIDLIHAGRPDFGVIIYTGHRYEDLKKSGEEPVQKLLGLTDILIDGEYVEELDDNLGLRGSSNQKAVFLSERYSAHRDLYTNPSGRKNSIEIQGDSLRMTGVPSSNTKEILRKTGIL